MLKQTNITLHAESFYNTVINLISKNFDYNSHSPRKIWIGYSGGLDSRVLLELASTSFKKNPNYKLIAVHINHNLNKNAALWQQHCNATCKELDIEFHSEQVIIDELNNLGSLEAELRAARISIWKKLLSTDDILLLGHHLNDQVETMFLRLIRGTGVKGLTGIKEANILNGLKVVRPLLNYTKQEILNFATQHNLNYIEDDSNLDQKFLRNFLRHSILPLLQERCPGYLSNVNRTVKLLQNHNTFLNTIVKKLLIKCYNYVNYSVDNCINNIKVLSIKKLLQQEQFLQFEILRNFIASKGFEVPSLDKINRIYQEIIFAKSDRQPKLQFNKYIICRYRDNLYIYAKKYFFEQQLKIKYRADKFRDSNIGRAKKIFQKFSIPPWLRKKYRLIFAENELIAVTGLWIKGL